MIKDIIHTLNDLNYELISSICDEIVKGKEILIFATGNTRILAQFFYFILETMGYQVKLISSLYYLNVYDVNQKIIIVISISGINTKCERFLNIIKNKTPLMKIAISASEQCTFKDNVDFHFHGYVNNFVYLYSKSVHLNDKYLVQLILDNFIIELYKKTIKFWWTH